MGKFRSRLKITNFSLCRWCKTVDEREEHVFTSCESVDVTNIKNKLQIHNARVLHTDPPLGLLFFWDAIGPTEGGDLYYLENIYLQTIIYYF